MTVVPAPRPNFSQADPSPCQANPSKNSWFCLVLFVRIGTFQWVKMRKIRFNSPASSPRKGVITFLATGLKVAQGFRFSQEIAGRLFRFLVRHVRQFCRDASCSDERPLGGDSVERRIQPWRLNPRDGLKRVRTQLNRMLASKAEARGSNPFGRAIFPRNKTGHCRRMSAWGADRADEGRLGRIGVRARAAVTASAKRLRTRSGSQRFPKFPVVGRSSASDAQT
jgi:hypothetical protein